VCILLLITTACDGGSPDGGGLVDAGGRADVAWSDARVHDLGGGHADAAGRADSGAPDVGARDAGTPDSGRPDAGPDAGAPDGVTADAAPAADAERLDAGTPPDAAADAATDVWDAGAPGPPACPEYSPFGNGVGSTFTFDQSTADYSATARGSITARRPSGDVTWIEMEWETSAVGPDWTNDIRTLSTYVCDAAGVSLVTVEGSSTAHTVNGTYSSSYSQEFDGFLTMLHGPLPAGQRWISTYTVRTTQGGSTTTSEPASIAYRVIGPKRVTVPAGTFDGVEIEITVEGAAPIRSVVVLDLGSVDSGAQRLVSYSLR
jgi:hypothetical protein